MNDLVIRALQKRGINGENRQHSIFCKTRGKYRSVLLSYADVEKAVVKPRRKFSETGAGGHGSRDGAYLII